MLWFTVISSAALAFALIVVAFGLLSEPEAPRWGPLIAALSAASALSVSAMLLVHGRLHPQHSAARLLVDSDRAGALYVASSRRGDLSTAITIGCLVATFGVGAAVAEGGWSVVLGVLAALVALAGVGAATALRRPRYLRITAEGLESAALRSHTTATWDGLQHASISFVSGGGGQMLARLSLPHGTPGYREIWRNRLEFRRTAVDIEYSMAYAHAAPLLQLVAALIENPTLRGTLVDNRALLCEALADPTRPRPWQTTAAG
jgi:hypothetical protein